MASIKHKDIIIDINDPFKNCKLGRKPYAEVLTSIVDSYRDGFVLAVNGNWGTGKTTFMKMWNKSLQNDGYKTIFFNAWENDFTSEPLVAILGELRKAIRSKDQEKFDSFLEKASKFSSTVFPTLAKTALTFAGFGQLAEAVEKISAATVQMFKDEIEDYNKKKESLEELKGELSEFIKDDCVDKPLIFIVDELDRCRPDYAVEVLEKIKHFFAVEGIVFILSIDKIQFGNSIRGFYGSDKIDSEEYLRRFIDLEYTLPEPNYDDFCNYMYDYYCFGDFFRAKTRIQYFGDEKESFIKNATTLISSKKLSLRQIEKLFIQTRVALRLFKSDNYVFPELLFFLIYLKYYYSDFYSRMCSQQLTIQELIDFIEKIFDLIIREEKDKEYTQSIHFIIAKLLILYRNMFQATSVDLIEKVKNTDGYKLSFNVKTINSEKLLEAIQHIEGKRGYTFVISHFTRKINLLESLKS